MVIIEFQWRKNFEIEIRKKYALSDIRNNVYDEVVLSVIYK